MARKMQYDQGTYQIRLVIKRKTKIPVGSLGMFDFESGIYVYTGRAKRALSSRLLRHLNKDKPRCWHIDYLTTHPDVNILDVAIVSPDPQDECIENKKLLRCRDNLVPAKGFGSSDCKSNCSSHLVKVG